MYRLFFPLISFMILVASSCHEPTIEERAEESVLNFEASNGHGFNADSVRFQHMPHFELDFALSHESDHWDLARWEIMYVPHAVYDSLDALMRKVDYGVNDAAHQKYLAQWDSLNQIDSMVEEGLRKEQAEFDSVANIFGPKVYHKVQVRSLKDEFLGNYLLDTATLKVIYYKRIDNDVYCPVDEEK